MKHLKKTPRKKMNRTRWIIAAVLVCLLPLGVWKGYRSLQTWKLYRVDERKGREEALRWISEGRLHITIGEWEPWRLTYERLLAERYGLRFPPPPDPRRFDINLMMNEPYDSAFQKVMNAEIERRFQPGELEAVAREAESVYQKCVAEGWSVVDPILGRAIIPSIGQVTAAAGEEGRRFLTELESRAAFPASNEPGKDRVTRSIISGSRGHLVKINGIQDLPRQMEIALVARGLVNESGLPFAYLEFRDEQLRRVSQGGNPVIDKKGKPVFGSGALRFSCIVSRGDPAELVEKMDRSIGPDFELVGDPWSSQETLGEDFVRLFAEQADYPDFQITSGSLAHRVQIYGVPDPVVQDKMLEAARNIIVPKGRRVEFAPVRVEFYEKRQGGIVSGWFLKRPVEKPSRTEVLTSGDQK